MATSIDVTCMNCDAVVRVVAVGYGVIDEKKSFDCPECGKPLCSWDDSAVVYDIERVLVPSKRSDNPAGET